MKYSGCKINAYRLATRILLKVTVLFSPIYAHGQIDTCLTINQLRAVWTWHEELQAADELNKAQSNLIYSLTIQDRLKQQQISSLQRQSEVLQMQRGYQQQIAQNYQQEKIFYENLSKKKERESRVIIGIIALSAVIFLSR